MAGTRREFLGASLIAAAAAATMGLATPARAKRTSSGANRRNLDMLVLGGTGFIGPYVVRYALERGHTVTLFNRGQTNAHLFPDLEKLIGDRDGQLDALIGRRWDVVLDNTGYVPRHVRDSANLLADACDRYLFTSTRQVFADFRAPDKKEDAPRIVLDDPITEDYKGSYGELKVLCEDAVNEVYGERATIVRPTAVAGPHDRSDRFTYWPVRINQGGEVLAPGDFTDPIQYIDVRDLAEFMVHLLEDDIAGAFNAAGPQADMGVAEFLYGCRAITSADVRFTWAPADFLAQHNVRPRRGMPLWIDPKIKGETRSPINRDKAVAQGLTFRPLAVTARDTLDWFLSKPADEQTLRTGLSREREKQVLAAWRAGG